MRRSNARAASIGFKSSRWMFSTSVISSASSSETFRTIASLFQPGALSSPPPAFASDELKAIADRANHDRLNDAAGLNRARQFVEGFFAETRTRLIGARLNQIDIDFVRPLAERLARWCCRSPGCSYSWRWNLAFCWWRCWFRLPNERSEPPSQGVSRHWQLPPGRVAYSPRPLYYVYHRK